MKQTARILKLTGKKLETVEEVRLALIAILEDIESGDATIANAKPIKEEIQILMRKLCTQMNSAKLKDKAQEFVSYGYQLPGNWLVMNRHCDKKGAADQPTFQELERRLDELCHQVLKSPHDEHVKKQILELKKRLDSLKIFRGKE